MRYDNGVNLLSIAAPIFPLLNINPVTHFLYFEFILGKQMGNNIILFLFSLFSILNLASCNTTEPPDNNNNGQDTTSHNFTWQSWTFGEIGTSRLYDVAIVDENNIWAVGEIYLLDSLGQPDPRAYNALHWDGIKFEIERIPYYYQ